MNGEINQTLHCCFWRSSEWLSSFVFKVNRGFAVQTNSLSWSTEETALQVLLQHRGDCVASSPAAQRRLCCKLSWSTEKTSSPAAQRRLCCKLQEIAHGSSSIVKLHSKGPYTTIHLTRWSQVQAFCTVLMGSSMALDDACTTLQQQCTACSQDSTRMEENLQ